jgi:surface protein
MECMFQQSNFNQPIEEWNVSKVTDMTFMFNVTPFNQPIGKWNVRNVRKMIWMFRQSTFNQNISNWCVSIIPIEPEDFSINSPLTEENKPKWGTCPD